MSWHSTFGNQSGGILDVNQRAVPFLVTCPGHSGAAHENDASVNLATQHCSHRLCLSALVCAMHWLIRYPVERVFLGEQILVMSPGVHILEVPSFGLPSLVTSESGLRLVCV